MKKTITIISLLLIGTGLFLGYRTLRFVKSAEHARGTVTHVGGLSEEGKGFPALINFHDRNEVIYEVKIYTRFRMLGGVFKEGDAVDVLYNAADPKGSAEVNSVLRLWSWPGMFLLVGLLFFILAVRT